MTCRLWQKRKEISKSDVRNAINCNFEINKIVVKLTNMKQHPSQMKQSVRINDLHEGAMAGIGDTPANIEVSNGQEPQSRDMAVCAFKKADISCDTKQPMNDPIGDNTEQQHDQFDECKTAVTKRK